MLNLICRCEKASENNFTSKLWNEASRLVFQMIFQISSYYEYVTKYYFSCELNKHILVHSITSEFICNTIKFPQGLMSLMKSLSLPFMYVILFIAGHSWLINSPLIRNWFLPYRQNNSPMVLFTDTRFSHGGYSYKMLSLIITINKQSTELRKREY